MKSMNEALLERKVDAQYATLSLVLWAAKKKQFTFASAGGLPPLIYRKGKVIETKLEGVPIGLLENQIYEQVQVSAEKNDLLIFYSDGVEDQLGPEAATMSKADALSEDMETYGREKLERVVMANRRKKPQEIAELIFTDIDEFRAATTLTDDQTIVALRIL